MDHPFAITLDHPRFSPHGARLQAICDTMNAEYGLLDGAEDA